MIDTALTIAIGIIFAILIISLIVFLFSLIVIVFSWIDYFISNSLDYIASGDTKVIDIFLFFVFIVCICVGFL
jgi:hypothetical protein